MAGTITVGELLSDPTSSNKITIGSGTTLDLAGSAGSVTGAGKVLQADEYTSVTDFYTTSTTLAYTGYSISITPSSTASKVALFCMYNANISTHGSAGLRLAFYRDTLQIGDENIAYQESSSSSHFPSYLQHLDSPNTTSPVTYKIYARSHSGSSERIAADWGHVRLMALEIGA